ncbi:MFS transporter [Frankia sp. CNm7]|uniref:MFS transporter n=1 Tax=Frankia nepalensis TaxID=1836974 RepID=A0A937RL04_9ACTN|nr:MFS transporter [Frankia nepalensis]MBL7497845.1 MFS transporter [Frankia nepalensis]MBL7509668.1 MFS transporter [Frankia nepalensis]MBL7520967.1 MFS transporter [Frankia nepalensis]MBL7630835.1 MFS transporter [Frankia nepalensis]
MSARASQPASSTATGHPAWIVGVLASAGIVISVSQTIVVPLIPSFPSLLRTSASNASWVITATLLTAAVAMPVLGRLGDLYGKRRMMLVSTWSLVAGSALCALSSSLVPIVVGRALQGVGMGVIPLGLSVMRDVLPPRRLPGAVAVMSSSMGVGASLGLPLSAVVAQNADWHVLFWISGATGLVFAVLLPLVVPEPPTRAEGRFDLAGAVALSVGLTALLLMITKGTDWGWASPTTLSLLAAAVVVLASWGAWELRVSAPLVDLRTTARRPVLLTNLAGIVIGFAMYANGLVVPQLLQLPEATGYGLGQSLLAAGLWMAPGGLGMMLFSPVTARLIGGRGPKWALVIGSAVVAAGYLLALPLMGSTIGVVAFSLVISSGVALAYGAMPALIMDAVPLSQSAAANSLNSLMRSVGTSTSSAVIAMVLAHLTVSLGPTQVPSEAGVRLAFLLGAAAAVAALLIALALPARHPRTTADKAALITTASGPALARPVEAVQDLAR